MMDLTFDTEFGSEQTPGDANRESRRWKQLISWHKCVRQCVPVTALT